MPHVAKTREQAIADGTYKLHPERFPERPKSEYAVGDAPDHCTDEVKAVWNEIRHYAAQGVLTGGDRFALEIAATILAEFRQDPNSCPSSKVSQMVNLLARFGLTPADRSKLAPKDDGTKPKNPFGALDD